MLSDGFALPKESIKALSVRSGVFPCDFGVSSFLFGFRGSALVPCFRFGLVASPSPLRVFFPFGPFLAVCFCLFFLFLALLLHLASFSLG